MSTYVLLSIFTLNKYSIDEKQAAKPAHIIIQASQATKNLIIYCWDHHRIVSASHLDAITIHKKGNTHTNANDIIIHVCSLLFMPLKLLGKK